MSLLHHQSCESVHTGLDLFGVPPTQTAVEDGAFVEYHPLSTLSPNAPIDFTISGTTSDYLDLSNTYLHIRAKITKNDGTDLDANTDVSPVNYWLHALFSQVDVSLNDTLISSSENTYPYRAYLESTLNYGKEANHLSCGLYYRDTPGHLHETQGNNNVGLQIRRQLTAQSAEVDMMGRLHTDIAHQERCMINGVNVKIRLTPSKNTFNLIAHVGGAGEPFKSIITHASLFVRKVKLNPAVALAHEKTLEKTSCKYPLKRVVLKTFAVPQGNHGAIQDNLFLSQTPTKIVIGLLGSADFNGLYGTNPFNFRHFNLNYLCLHMDGRQIPGKALTPDFEHSRYVRAYQSLMLATGVLNKDAGNDITYRDYGRGYTLYAFDLSPSLLDGDQQFELIKSSALRLELKFSQALPEPIQALVYAELDSMIEIDRSRQVLTDYSS